MRKQHRKAGSREIYSHPRKNTSSNPKKPNYFQGKYWLLAPSPGGPATKYFEGTTKGEVAREIDAFERRDKQELQERQRREAEPFLTKSVKAFLEEWMKCIAIRETTRELYDSTLRTHIYADDEFCKIELGKLGADDVNTFLSRRKDAGASEDTRHRVYKLLHAAFQTAVEEGKFARNPVKIAKSKRPPKRRSIVVSFTPEHEAMLRQFVGGKPFWGPLVHLAVDSGMREAEILGLQKSNVHATSREVKVRTTLNTVRGKAVLGDVPKTHSSYRTIKLSKTTMEALRSHLKANLASASSFVFLDPDGQPWTRSNFYKAWKRLLDEGGVQHYHFHACRHTCATRLLRRGNYITAVQKRLGHRYPSITLDCYSDALPDDQERLADDYDAVVAESALQNTLQAEGS